MKFNETLDFVIYYMLLGVSRFCRFFRIQVYMYSLLFIFQPDCLDDLAFAIMHEITKLAHRVSD